MWVAVTDYENRGHGYMYTKGTNQILGSCSPLHGIWFCDIDELPYIKLYNGFVLWTVTVPGDATVFDARHGGKYADKLILSDRRRNDIKTGQVRPPKTSIEAAKQIRNGTIGLQDVSHSLLTDEICIVALSRATKGGLDMIPESARTLRVCKSSLERSIFNMEFVPESLITEELCRFAIDHLTSTCCFGRVFDVIPSQFLDANLYHAAVKKHVKLFEYVPIEHKTPELCEMAVRQDAWMIKHVPESILTPSLCRIAILAKSSVAGYLVKRHGKSVVSTDTWMEAFKNDKDIVNLMPHELITEDMFIQAIEYNPDVFYILREEDITENLCLAACSIKGYLLDYIGGCDFEKNVLRKVPSYCTEKVCLAAIAQDAHAIRYVPYSLLTPEMALLALESHNLSLVQIKELLPTDIMTPEVCFAMVRKYPESINYIPNARRTEEMYMEVIKTTEEITLVPEYDRTENMQQLANELFQEKRKRQEKWVENEYEWNCCKHSYW